MRTRFDHAVVVVDALVPAADAFRAAGFTVTPGGRHDALPTENALVAFADGSYVELLAFREPSARDELRALRASARWESHRHGVSAIARRFLPRLAGPAGVGDACIGGERLARFAAESRRREVVLTGPVAMRRERAGADALRWELLLPADDTIPFLIEDRTPREARVPGGDAARHANGATGIAGVALRAAAPPLAAMRLADLFGAALEARPDGGACVRYAGVAWTLEPGEPEGAFAVTLAGVPRLPDAIEALGVRGEAAA